MNDHKIPNAEPEGIVYIKRLQIYLTVDGADPLNELRFHIYGFEPADETEEGRPIAAGEKLYELIGAFIPQPPVLPQPAVPTPLDFWVKKPCCVVLKLIGDFWEFSPDGPDGQAIRTKKDLGGRYCKLRHHTDEDGKIRAVSFFVQEVKQASENVKDGINLYVDFLQDKRRLPVIIDPDIENKGDGPPLIEG